MAKRGKKSGLIATNGRDVHVHVETREGIAVTVHVHESGRERRAKRLRDEEIYWEGPETAEEIIADIYSRR